MTRNELIDASVRLVMDNRHYPAASRIAAAIAAGDYSSHSQEAIQLFHARVRTKFRDLRARFRDDLTEK